ncbi:MAG: tyrosine-type recombinase/integrase [Actinobacteria bacterium]|nr:tyrosine-type recombinase/integrase [Actinomycetota bacterium]MBE3121495.1 tyrosine-type recombinase/integrase [Thermoplasmata archaeon]
MKLKKIAPPRAKIVTNEDVKNLFKYLYERDKKHFLRLKAFILVMSTSGIRDKEAFQLTLSDIDLLNNKIYIRYDKTHTQKTGQERIVFITDNAKHCLEKYIKQNKNRKLFNESTLTRAFNGANIRMKDLRKYFSQNWIRKEGNQLIKEILLGHSLKGNVDAMHYCSLTDEELYIAYRKVMEK